MTTPLLARCPFCGGTPSVEGGTGSLWVGFCNECGSRGRYADTEEKATENWNRRHTDPSLERLMQAAVEYNSGAGNTGVELANAAMAYAKSVRKP